MRRALPFRCAALGAAAAALLPASALAQRSETEVKSDIEFAKGLAEWGFVDLSQKVIANLEASGLSGAHIEEVALLKCAAYFEAAKSNAARRDELLEAAMDAYAALSARLSESDLKQRVDSGLVEVASYYARSLALKLQDAVGPEAEATRAEMQKVLESAVSRVNELLDASGRVASADRTEATQRRRYELLFTNGELCLEWAKIQDVGTANFERSLSSYTKLSDEATEGTPWSLRAFIGIGDNYVAQAERETDFKAAAGLFQEAANYYEFAVDFSVPRDMDAWKQMLDAGITQDEKQARFLFVQMGTPGLIKAYLGAGNGPKALEWALHFHNVWKREGVDLVQPIGYFALLDVARSMVDAGGFIGGNQSAGEARWYESVEAMQAANIARARQQTALDFAMSLAQYVAAQPENKGTLLQYRAQKVIGEIISRPGVKVDPGVLFAAAEGSYREQDWYGALDGMKRVVLALDGRDQATRLELMPKVLNYIGLSYKRLERTIEAAAVFEHALDAWQGDPEFDQQNAKGFLDMAKQLERGARGEQLYTQMVQRAEQLLVKLAKDDGVGGAIIFRKAEKLKDEKKYADAKLEYSTITPEAKEWYERALVAVGECEFRLENFEAAIRIFDQYLNVFLQDPANETREPKVLAKRKEATANAVYYWGVTLYGLALDGKGKWEDVVAKLSNYHENFPEQTSYAARALYLVLYAHAQLGQDDKVNALLATMVQEFPDDQWTGRAAAESYTVLQKQYDAEQDAEKKKALLRKMAQNLQTLNKTSPKPKFANLRKESTHWRDLEEWTTAEDLLRRILDLFGSVEENAEDIDKFVKPDLGRVLIAQDKSRDATAVLEPLMAEGAKVRASKETAFLYSISVTGWLTWDAQKKAVLEHAGSGDSDEAFKKAMKPLNQLYVAEPAWQSADFYRYRAQLTWAVYQWAKYDGKMADEAKVLVQKTAQQLGGEKYRNEFLSGDLTEIYLWLSNKIR